MIIYHKTNNQIFSTQVVLSAKGSEISTGTFVWNKHRENVDKLENDGDVFITGASFAGAEYSGFFDKREKWIKEIER